MREKAFYGLLAVIGIFALLWAHTADAQYRSGGYTVTPTLDKVLMKGDYSSRSIYIEDMVTGAWATQKCVMSATGSIYCDGVISAPTITGGVASFTNIFATDIYVLQNAHVAGDLNLAGTLNAATSTAWFDHLNANSASMTYLWVKYLQILFGHATGTITAAGNIESGASVTASQTVYASHTIITDEGFYGATAALVNLGANNEAPLAAFQYQDVTPLATFSKCTAANCATYNYKLIITNDGGILASGTIKTAGGIEAATASIGTIVVTNMDINHASINSIDAGTVAASSSITVATGTITSYNATVTNQFDADTVVADYVTVNYDTYMNGDLTVDMGITVYDDIVAATHTLIVYDVDARGTTSVDARGTIHTDAGVDAATGTFSGLLTAEGGITSAGAITAATSTISALNLTATNLLTTVYASATGFVTVAGDVQSTGGDLVGVDGNLSGNVSASGTITGATGTFTTGLNSGGPINAATSTITAGYFSGDGSLLTNVTGTDATRVLKAGDTMTGELLMSGTGGLNAATAAIGILNSQTTSNGIISSSSTLAVSTSSTWVAIRAENTGTGGAGTFSNSAPTTTMYVFNQDTTANAYGIRSSVAGTGYGLYSKAFGNGYGLIADSGKYGVYGRTSGNSGYAGWFQTNNNTPTTSAALRAHHDYAFQTNELVRFDTDNTTCLLCPIVNQYQGTTLVYSTDNSGNVYSSGTVTANQFVGGGAGLTGISGTDSSRVLKVGDTMTGSLNLSAAGISAATGSFSDTLTAKDIAMYTTEATPSISITANTTDDTISAIQILALTGNGVYVAATGGIGINIVAGGESTDSGLLGDAGLVVSAGALAQTTTGIRSSVSGMGNAFVSHIGYGASTGTLYYGDNYGLGPLVELRNSNAPKLLISNGGTIYASGGLYIAATDSVDFGLMQPMLTNSAAGASMLCYSGIESFDALDVDETITVLNWDISVINSIDLTPSCADNHWYSATSTTPIVFHINLSQNLTGCDVSWRVCGY